MADTCTCKFIGPGLPMVREGCVIHTENSYKCDVSLCSCTNYRPQHEPYAPRIDGKPGRQWPLCVCGHIAQDHN